jgi:methylenetetrahydrofolate dehydrogenase (NADP+) / methenyltetrahydrofolate cyclohydrolase / formyltetrahydrofolate synthetase
VFVHAGPFANIAHGNSSILADRVALLLAGTEEGDGAERVGYVLTEGGFGADMGMEKFCDIKCRVSGLRPDAVVIVATTRALKMHGGGPEVTPGKPLHETYTREDLGILKEGCANLVRHVRNARKFGLKVIVAINQFRSVEGFCSDDEAPSDLCWLGSSDTPAELALVRDEALAGGADGAVVSNHWAEGGRGARALAEAVIAICEGESAFRFLYDVTLPIEEKIEVIAREIYGAEGIELSEAARAQVETYKRQGYNDLPSMFFAWSLFWMWAEPFFFTPVSSMRGEDAVLVLA